MDINLLKKVKNDYLIVLFTITIVGLLFVLKKQEDKIISIHINTSVNDSAAVLSK